MLLSSTALSKALKTNWTLHTAEPNTAPKLVNECLELKFSGKFLYDQSRMELKINTGKRGDRLFFKKRSTIMGKPGNWREVTIANTDVIVITSGFVLAGTDAYIDYRSPISRSYYTPVVFPHPRNALSGFTVTPSTERKRTMPTSETLIIKAEAGAAIIHKGDPVATLGFARMAGGTTVPIIKNESKHFYPIVC